MNDDRHQELRLLVQADCDGELPPRDAAAVAAHLEGCAACRALQDQLRATKAAVHAEATRHTAPDRVRQHMETMIAASAVPQRAPAPRRAWGGWIGSFGVGAALAAAPVLLVVVPQDDSGVARSVLDGHLRALQSSHLYDVASTDQHTVKPWFDGRVDFAPPVKDLAALGFPLKGGRLDTVDGRTVAALVYGRAKHVIDLYVWQTPGAGAAPPRDLTRNGYNLVSWSNAAMTFWAVSDLNRQELDEFVRDWQAAP